MQVLNSVNPIQASTNTNAIVTNSTLEAAMALSVSFTIKNTGDNSINWTVVAGNVSDLSDGNIVKVSETLAANAISTYAVSIAPYLYYAVYIQSAVADTHGEATVKGAAKG